MSEETKTEGEETKAAVPAKEQAIATLAKSGVGVSLADLLGGMQNVAMATEGNDGGMPLLKIQKGVGAWRCGSNNDALAVERVEQRVGKNVEVTYMDALLRVDVLTFEWGHVCWKDKDPISRMGPVFRPQPEPGPDQGPHTKGEKAGQPTKWEEQYGTEIDVLTGPLAGSRILYRNNSKGALAFFGTLAKFVNAKVQGVEDPAHAYVFPVIRPASEIYVHGEYGETAKPRLVVVEWQNAAGETEPTLAARVAEAHEADADEAEGVIDAVIEENEEAPPAAPQKSGRRRAAPPK